MIRHAFSREFVYLRDTISNSIYNNVYLYIDTCTYGFSDDNIQTFVSINSDKNIDAIIYEYYNSIQLLEINHLNENQISEIASFIIEHRYRRISGNSEFIKRLHFFLMGVYDLTNGILMKYADAPHEYDKAFLPYFAAADDFDEIAKLICNDPHLGKSYNESSLKEQLLKRYLEDGCENICIKCDGMIVSHFATYAITKNLAVLSGMVTHPLYRGRGMGSVLVKDLSMHLVKKGRTPLLYCYEEGYFTWYEKLGYLKIGTNSKLELKAHNAS